MKAMILIVLLALLCGCEGEPPKDDTDRSLVEYRDPKNGVVCYKILLSDGISCIQVSKPAASCSAK